MPIKKNKPFILIKKKAKEEFKQAMGCVVSTISSVDECTSDMQCCLYSQVKIQEGHLREERHMADEL